ncbi:L-ribulose-5-phosphate 4-epimerase [Enterococcus sp. PF1-24]|uniref:class II aldolase/adducin family protein n=1 Tax=unclassified Enterococcus TaxID=2608891 RepID=UPI002474FE75|nr:MULTISPECIES: class II aldolase/adducin family protein [unclassified Enterococcus]MDH6363953.1 L-ribulose-5-phosphate 4-epimerase [Enterococcus sp. PFB1-1]MDH6401054.1 L-ribulose-5-phosphate 4-epimerase [Enterococcus sp. PF1-24]
MKVAEAKEQVLEIAQKAYREKLMAGTSGNISLYLHEENKVVITPSSIDYLQMTVEDISVITLEGEILEGPHQPSSEWPMHTEIYKEFQESYALVHTHSPYATAFAVCGEEIPEILIEMKPFIGGDIKVAPFAPAGSVELGKVTAPYLKERKACLLANHGTMSIGKDLSSAYISSIYLEDAAKIYAFAKSVGKPIVLSSERGE